MTHSFPLITDVNIFNHALQWFVDYNSNAKQTGHLKMLGYRFDKFVHDMKCFIIAKCSRALKVR